MLNAYELRVLTRLARVHLVHSRGAHPEYFINLESRTEQTLVLPELQSQIGISVSYSDWVCEVTALPFATLVRPAKTPSNAFSF